MANVELSNPSGDLDLRMAARVTGIAAIVLGAAELLALVTNFSMTEAVYAVLGNDGFFWIFRVLWIITVAASAVAAGGLIVGWRQAPLVWRPGIGAVALGLVLRWAWWAVDRFTDVWQLGRFVGVDPTDPDLVNTLLAATWMNVAVSVVSIALLISGGIRLLLRRPASD